MRYRTENIYQVIDTSATPAQVYSAFTKQEIHSAFTRMGAQINAEEGGKFISCGGQSFGRYIRLVKNKRLVLSWSHKELPKDYYTTVHIEIEKTPEGSRVHFNHVGVPDSCDGWLTDCWTNTYWRPMVAYFENTALATA